MEQDILKGLNKLSLPATQERAEQLAAYARLMLERNQNVNLTAITSPEGIVALHFLDSAALLLAADFARKKVIDIGTGAGFPGIVLKILEPSIDLTLLDSTGKKLKFVREASETIGIKDIKFLQGRAEEYSLVAGNRDSYDIAVSRAVAEMPLLTELMLPFVAPRGHMIAMKAGGSEEEIKRAEHAVAVLGGRFLEPFRYAIPDSNMNRLAVIVEKILATPRGFPRRFSKIQKEPL